MALPSKVVIRLAAAHLPGATGALLPPPGAMLLVLLPPAPVTMCHRHRLAIRVSPEGPRDAFPILGRINIYSSWEEHVKDTHPGG